MAVGSGIPKPCRLWGLQVENGNHKDAGKRRIIPVAADCKRTKKYYKIYDVKAIFYKTHNWSNSAGWNMREASEEKSLAAEITLGKW